MAPFGTAAAQAAVTARLWRRWAPQARFVVFGPGRCGSELLVELLRSHPDIECEGELLAEPLPDPRRALRTRAAWSGRAGYAAFGCKVLVGQVTTVQRVPDPLSFVSALVEDGWTVVGLVRRNVLRQSLSWVRADQTGQYHDRGDGPVRTGPVRVPPEELISMMVAHEAANSVVEEAVRLAHRSVLLEYEQHLAAEDAHEGTAAAVVSLLGLEPVVPRTGLRRRPEEDLRTLLTNFDQVADVVARTRFAPLLET